MESNVKAEERKEYSTPRKTAYFFVAGLIITLAVIIQITKVQFGYNKDQTRNKVDQTVNTIFKAYDTNKDGVLDISEFVPIAKRLSDSSFSAASMDVPLSSESMEFSDADQEHIIIKAMFTPLILESMSKFKDSFFQFSDKNLQGLKSWKGVVNSHSTFPVQEFAKAFLPDFSVKVGQPWYIVKPDMKEGQQLSSLRYQPPPISSPKHDILHKLLKMFHPRPFLHMRFAPQGTIACLRALNMDYYHIFFRMHSEFQLNEPPDQLPFWFTPAQFMGELITTRNGSHIVHFSMIVPTNQSLNVDMEWQTSVPDSNTDGGSQSGTEVDIGYLPQMELFSIRPSNKKGNFEQIFKGACGVKSSLSGDKDINRQGSYCIQSNDNAKMGSSVSELADKDGAEEGVSIYDTMKIKWDDELSKEEVWRHIDVTFYPFQKVSYVDLTEAIKSAKEENKLLHVILLWGALADQSC